MEVICGEGEVECLGGCVLEWRKLYWPNGVVSDDVVRGCWIAW